MQNNKSIISYEELIIFIILLILEPLLKSAIFSKILSTNSLTLLIEPYVKLKICSPPKLSATTAFKELQE